VLIVAKDPGAHEFLSRQFHEKLVKKLYVAVVKGTPAGGKGWIKTGLLRDPRNRKRFTWSRAGGKPSATYYRVLRSFEGYSLVVLIPRTGGTHQIRVHCLSLGCPVLGDPVYSRRDKRFPEASLMLHSSRLGIHIPADGKDAGHAGGGVALHPEVRKADWRVFRSPLPGRFSSVVRVLNERS
jgi:23S rRNA pseudouridine1911/1915/1917 synthase